MKFPTLFGRTPDYRRFEYKPRFYDPQKEEREQRDRRIRQELALKESEAAEADLAGDYRSRIKGSFGKARKRAKPSSETSAVLLRLAVLLFISLFLVAYLTWGNVAFYSFFAVFPVWVYFRFFRK